MLKFIVFGDGSFGIRGAANRLANQAQKSGLFDGGVKRWDATALRLTFSEDYSDVLNFIFNQKKGFGLWVWQPLILLKELLDSPEGEILVMLDAGCQLNLNPASLNRFDEYIEIVEEMDALFTQIRTGSFGLAQLAEIYWNKCETLSEIPTSSEYLRCNQIQSGIILIKRSDKSIRFVEEWLRLCTMDDFRLIRDVEDRSLEIEGFQSHRYSQAVLSLLVKNSDFSVVQDETYWSPNWSTGLSFPIWAMRNRSGGDAYRRNLSDLVKIGFARLERRLQALQGRNQ